MLKKRYLWFALAAVAATSFACGDSGSSGEQDGECKVKEDCPEGQICNADNKCEANVECTEATQEEDCPAGQICKDGKCDVKPECVESKDCEENFECVSNKCKPLPECTEEGDCVAKYGDHYICTSGTCEVDPNYKEVTEADVAISLKEADALEVSEDGTTAQFYVVLDRDPLLPVSLKIASSNTDEGTVSPSTLSFDSSNWDKPQPVTVTGVDDNVIDGDQKFDVTVTYNKISETGESVVGEQKTVSVTNKDNDVAGVVLNGAENLVTTEDKESATFTLTLTVKPESAVTLKLSSDNPAEGTVEPAEITIDPEDWNVAQHVDVIGVGDFVVDGDQKYNVKIEFESEDANFNGIEPVLVPVTNKDTNTVGIAVSPKTDLVVAEDGTYVEFQVLLTKAPTDNVTVIANSSDDTEGLLAIVVYPKPQEPEPGNELLADGAECEKGEDCQSGICEAESEEEGAKMVCIGIPGDELLADGTECEKDDDCKSGSCKPESEEEGATLVCVAQPGDEPEPEPEPEVSEKAASQTLVFTTENWNVPQIIRVIGIPDNVIDGDVPFTVTLSASSSDEDYVNLEEKVEVTNLDKTEAGVIVEHDSIDEETGKPIKITDFSLTTNEAGGTDSFTVRLVSEPASEVTINLSSSNTAEGTVAPASVTFNADNWNTPQTVTVTGIDDSVADKDVAYTVELADVVSEDENYNGKFGKTINAINLDNETVGITINPPNSPFEILENAAAVKVKMALKSEPKSSVKIYHETDNSDIVNFKKGHVEIKPADWSKGAEIGIKGINNNYADGNKDFVLHFRTESDDPDYNDLTVDLAGKRIDDEHASVVVSKTQLQTSEDGLSDTFTLTLTSRPYKPVTVSFTGIDSTEGTFSPAQIVFDDSNWNDEILVTVIGKDDNEVDGPITYEVTVKAASEDPAYNIASVGKIKVTNANNDIGSVTVNPTAINITDSGTFTVKLDYKPLSNVEIPVSSSNATYGTVSTSKLTFTPSNWNMPQTVTVTTKTYPYRNAPKSSYQIKLGNTVSTSAEYNNVPVSSVAVTGNPSTVVYNYAYTGARQTASLPKGSYRLEVWGAQGGYRSVADNGGKGGYSEGTLTLTSTTTLYIYVGGQGNNGTCSGSICSGGFNGGGYRYAYKGGGGATDIRIGSDNLYSRIIVAGGGGSDGASNKPGAYGGGVNGGSATESYGSYGGGGNATMSGGSTSYTTSTQATSGLTSSSHVYGGFGFGGAGVYRSSGYGGAGGGGWYGGCGAYPDGSADDDRGGGGGSGYVYTSATASQNPGTKPSTAYYLTGNPKTYDAGETIYAPDGKTEAGHTGNGYARIYKVAN